jgi:hypothetical protein
MQRSCAWVTPAGLCRSAYERVNYDIWVCSDHLFVFRAVHCRCRTRPQKSGCHIGVESFSGLDGCGMGRCARLGVNLPAKSLLASDEKDPARGRILFRMRAAHEFRSDVLPILWCKTRYSRCHCTIRSPGAGASEIRCISTRFLGPRP